MPPNPDQHPALWTVPSPEEMVAYNNRFPSIRPFNPSFIKFISDSRDLEYIRNELSELELPTNKIYQVFRMFLMTTEQRKACGYPMPNLQSPGKVDFFNAFPYNEGIKCGLCKQVYSNGLSRCPYAVNNFAHAPLKVVLGDSERFVRTQSRKKPLRRILAMDCEMCVTTQGLEVAKVTMLDIKGNIVYDRFVQPENPILNYNTEYSGIAPYHLANVTTRLCDVQKELLELIDTSTIIMGHALENDFKALRLTHNLVIDTAVVFPDQRGAPFKRSLKNIVLHELKKEIQNDPSIGHDSRQDACACIMLMLHKLKSEQNLQKTLSLYTYYEPLAYHC